MYYSLDLPDLFMVKVKVVNNDNFRECSVSQFWRTDELINQCLFFRFLMHHGCSFMSNAFLVCASFHVHIASSFNIIIYWLWKLQHALVSIQANKDYCFAAVSDYISILEKYA